MGNASATAASDINGMIDEINRYQSSLDFTEFDIRRLKRAAIKIKENVSVADGFGLLGMVACLEGDLEAMRSCCERAVQQSGGDPKHLYNYSRSLKYHNLYGEAEKEAEKAYERNPSHPGYLDNLIEIDCVLGRKDRFRRHVGEWFELRKKRHWLEAAPLAVWENRRRYREFVSANPELDIIDRPPAFASECLRKLPEFFGIPLAIVIGIVPNEAWDSTMIVWAQWHGDFEEGLQRYFAFEEWYVDKGFDRMTGLLHFSFEFAEERCFSTGQS